MNYTKRWIALIVAVILSVSMLPAASAATANVTIYPGDERVTVTFTVEDIYSLYGVFSVKDQDDMITGWSARVANRGGMNGGNVNGDICYMYETSNPAKPRDVTLEVTLDVKKNTAVGDTAKVIFAYEKGIEISGMQIKTEEETAEVSVIVKQNHDDDTTKPTDDNSTTPTEDSTKPTDSETKPTNPTTDPTKPTVDTSGDGKPSTGNKPTSNNSSSGNSNGGNSTNATKPTEADTDMNYDDLQKQINIAKGFKEEDHDPEKWEQLQELLEKAEDALDSDDQDEVDKLAQELAAMNQSMAGLDTGKLQEAMDKVMEKSADTALSGLWYQMHELLNNGQALLDAGAEAAQSDVDAAVNHIEALLAEIEKENQAAAVTPGTMVEKVPVEVTPDGEFCNISLHKLWPILFFVSLALNIGFAVVIIVYLVHKKKNQKDDTPLVDYDIDDDDELDELDDGLGVLE